MYSMFLYHNLACKVNSLHKARECYYYLCHYILDQTNVQPGDCERIGTDAYEELPDGNVANNLGRVRNGKCMNLYFYLEPECIMGERHLMTTLQMRLPHLTTFVPKQNFPYYFMCHVSLAIQMKLLRVMTWQGMI